VAGVVLVKIFGAIPRTGLSENLRKRTERQTTPRLQTISARFLPEELDSHGLITITAKEARLGTRKMISVPQGLRKRTLMVTIPPKVGDGTRLPPGVPDHARGVAQQHGCGFLAFDHATTSESIKRFIIFLVLCSWYERLTKLSFNLQKLPN
jgi:hypothetical protein